MKTALGILALAISLQAAELEVCQPVNLKFTAADGRKVDLTKMRGKVVLRLAVGSPRTDFAHVDAVWACIQRHVDAASRD